MYGVWKILNKLQIKYHLIKITHRYITFRVLICAVHVPTRNDFKNKTCRANNYLIEHLD